MTSKEAIEELKTVLLTNKGTEKYADIFIENLIIPIEKDLDLLDSIKEVFKKVTYASFAINNNGKIEPVPTVKLAEDFDKELFRQVLEQCGFEIKEK